jgi:hypothetical protein
MGSLSPVSTTNRYSNRTPHGLLLLSKVKSKSRLYVLRPTVSQLVCLVFMHPLGTADKFFFFNHHWTAEGSLMCGTLSDEGTGYSWCWASPQQSFSGPSPSGLTTIFYCLKFDAPPNWRARFSHFSPPRRE